MGENRIFSIQVNIYCILGGAKEVEMIKNLALAADATKDVPENWMVVVMGIGVVFVGLVLIILICKIMGLFFAKAAKQESKPAVVAAPAKASAVIENRQEIIAAITAACAEEMGKDISALRVVSFKKL